MQDDDKEVGIFRKPTGRALLRRTSPSGQQRKTSKLPPIIEGAEYKVVDGELVIKKVPKVVKNQIKITPGFFKSFDGRKIHVWYLNKTSEKFPVVGAIETNGVWEPRVWNLEGWTKEPFGQVNNIVSAWSEL